jgi:hypothetical protein
LLSKPPRTKPTAATFKFPPIPLRGKDERETGLHGQFPFSFQFLNVETSGVSKNMSATASEHSNSKPAKTFNIVAKSRRSCISVVFE